MRKIISPCIDHVCKVFGLGYATSWITVEGVKYTTTKHRAVFYKIAGYLPEVVMHTCDNARCINPEHLVGGTHLDNMQDMRNKGRQGAVRGAAGLRGEKSPSCKLSDDAVRYIRSAYVKGSREFGLVALAKQFGCGTSQIHRIVKGTAR